MPRGLGASKPLRSSEPEASCPLPPSRWLGAIRYFMCKQWRSQGCIFGGSIKGVARGMRGKGCGQNGGSQKLLSLEGNYGVS